MTNIKNHPRGAIALLVLLGVTAFSLMVLVSVSTLASNAFTITLAEAATEKTFYAAESGLNEGLYHLVNDAAPDDMTLNFNGVDVAITIRANPLNPYQRVLTSRAEDSSGKVRELEIIANTSAFAGGFDYAVQTGLGGVYMDNESRVIGNIYSNGMVTGKANAKACNNVTVANVAVIDQQDIDQNAEFEFGHQVGPITYADTGQSFVVGTSATMNRFSVMLKKIGNVNSNLWWRITADNAGQPANTALTFGEIDVDEVGINLSWHDVNLSTPIAVTAGTKYWLVLDAVNTNASRHWAVGIDTNDSYGPGTALYSSEDWDNVGVTWSPVEADGADFAFVTWLGQDSTRLEYITVLETAKANRITAAKVCGDAYYYSITATAEDFLNNPTESVCSATGPSEPCLPVAATPGTGFSNSPDPQPIPFPINDGIIQTWKNEITNTLALNCRRASGVGPNDTYCISGSQTLGAVKIEGDFYLDIDANLTLSGNVWVTGKIIFENNGSLSLAASLGSGSAVIIADGTVDVSNNLTITGNGDPHSFLLLLSTNTSLDVFTPAIYASNNSTSIIFGALKGLLKVKNNGALNAAVAEQLFLEPNSTVTYNPNLIYFTVPAGSETPVGTALGTWREK